jgi:hypothetical protein
LLFYFEKGSKRGIHSEISHTWKAYLTLEIVRQDKCPKYNGLSKLPVKSNPKSSVVSEKNTID